MTDRTAEPADELEDAFRLLANETRLAILFALWNAPSWTATFTELKDAVGARDSGGFQYHLNQLAGTFVRRTDDGYTHLAGGIALYRTMLGAVAGPESIEPIPLDRPCPDCDASLRLVYENQVFYARCPSCGETTLSAPFLPAGLENRTDGERLRAFDRWARRQFGLLADGVCPWCASTVSRAFAAGGPDERRAVAITHACDRCGGFLRTSAGEVVLDHPAVVSFLHERGVDPAAVPHWELDFCTSDEGVTVVAEDPWLVDLTIRRGGDSLTLRIDESCSVVDVERTGSDAAG